MLHLSLVQCQIYYSEIREPLHWTSEHQSCFEQPKAALACKLPDVSLPFIWRTDAHNSGLGAVLLQYHNGVPFPVAYASKKLLDREKRYLTIERECFAIIFGIQRFKYYLLGQEFILETNHKPLVYLNELKTYAMGFALDPKEHKVTCLTTCLFNSWKCITWQVTYTLMVFWRVKSTVF